MAGRRITLRGLRGEAARYARPSSARELAILEAATQLFGEKGFDGARTADIAAAARVTERTLFSYFPTKASLYRKVMFPALLSAAMPRLLMDAGRLFAAAGENVEDWDRRILTRRVEAARRAAPQFRLVLAALMSDEALRSKAVAVWKDSVLAPLVGTIRRYQKEGQLRADVRPEVIARAIISLNLGYIVARALLAPDAKWDDAAEIEATLEVLLRGTGRSKDPKIK
jgi:TetR/AcrR family transcriptional regulator